MRCLFGIVNKRQLVDQNFGLPILIATFVTEIKTLIYEQTSAF